MFTKSITVRYNDSLTEEELMDLQVSINEVPNTYYRYDDRNLTVLHFPFSSSIGFINQDEGAEEKWRALRDRFVSYSNKFKLIDINKNGAKIDGHELIEDIAFS